MKLNKKGFTLAELLIVIAIIAVLIAIAIPTFSGALENAKRQTDHANIRSAYSVMQIAKMSGQIEGADVEIGEYVMLKNGSFEKDGTNAYKLKAKGDTGAANSSCSACAGCPGYVSDTENSSHNVGRRIVIVVSGTTDSPSFDLQLKS